MASGPFEVLMLGLAAGLLTAGAIMGAWQRARAAAHDPWRWRWLLWPQLGLVLAISVAAYTGMLAGGRLPWLGLPGMDKALHFGLFGLLALGMHFATRGRTIGRGAIAVPLAVLIPMLGALVEELAQALSPYRSADPLDLLADLLGMIVFSWIGRRLTSDCAALSGAPR